MSRLRPAPTAVLTVLGVAAAVILSGCSLLPSIPGQGGGSSEESPAAPGSSDDNGDSGDSDADDDSGSDDDNEFASTTMPENFPESIPVPDLDLLLAIDLGTGWTVAYTSDDAVSDFDSLADEFSSGDWEQLSRETADGQGFAAYDSADYQVQLTAATENTGFDTPVLTMTVVRKD